MTSVDPRPGRARSLDDAAQGSLDGILEDGGPRGTREDAPRRRSRRSADKGSTERASEDRAHVQRTAGGALRTSLDRLEESVTLLLARHTELDAARAEAERRRTERDSLDPIALRDRVRTLEDERERLERHAAFLEARIRGLHSRVRYVVES